MRSRWAFPVFVALVAAIALPIGGATIPQGVRTLRLSTAANCTSPPASGSTGLCVQASDGNLYWHRVDNRLLIMGQAPTVNIDFTTGSTSSLVSYARTGDPICPQTSESSVNCTSATNTQILENRGTDDGAGYGLITVTGYSVTTGTGADQSYSCGVWFSCSSSPPTVTLNAAVAPDGNMTAGKIQDTSTSAVQSISIAYGGNSQTTGSVWVKNASPTPTGPGFLSVVSTLVSYASFGSSSTWHRVVYTAGGDGTLTIAPSATNATTATDTGAVDIWGDEKILSRTDFPLLRVPTRTTSAAIATLGSTALANLFPNGDANLELEFSTYIDYPENQGDAYLIRCQTPDGDFSLAESNSQLTWKVRGTTVAGPINVTPVAVRGRLMKTRLWYKPSTGQGGYRVSYNGAAYLDGTVSVSGSALSTPTACYLGSFDTSTFSINGRLHRLRNYVNNANLPIPAEMLVVGDSLSAGTTSSMWSQWMYADGTSRTRYGIGSIAHPADTISDQTTAYNAAPWKGSPNITAVHILIGINDIHVSCHDDVTVESDLQTLVNLVHSGNPQAMIFVSKLLPAKNYLLSQSPCGGHTGSQMEAYRENVNAWLHAGNLSGATLIETGSDALNDGSESLQSQYAAADLLHLTSLGEKVYGLAECTAIRSAGFTQYDCQ